MSSPDCRGGWPDAVLAAMVEAVGRAHALLAPAVSRGARADDGGALVRVPRLSDAVDLAALPADEFADAVAEYAVVTA
ncbi:hypothetical protein ABZ671_01310 [Micromonospora sp. NPDC006766]|uniref:hypothetical protein n=1 Tax=Micromonospora sp. NPDC006766 TaxID=3154778 RepID=UPI003405025D